MLTRRQKNSIRGFTAVMSCCALLAGFLIFTNISNAEKPERVVFSEILEGAVAYSDSSDAPAVTLASDKLMETMFSEKYATFTLPDADPFATYIPPSTLDTSDMQAYAVTPAETDDLPGIPDNPNEITLLSEELEELRTGTSDDTTTSADTTTSETKQDTSASTSKTIYEITAPTESVRTEITPASTLRTEDRIILTETTAESTTARTTKATTAKTTKAQTTVATTKNAGGTTSRPPITNIGGGKFSEDDTIYLTMLKLVNDARRAAGVNELWYSARVHDVCRLRANELSSYYSHNRPDGTRFSTAFKEIGINYEKCGENIAYGRNMFDTPEEVFNAWMDSPSHKENILSPDYECMAFGLSVLKVGNDTYYYWAQEFAKF